MKMSSASQRSTPSIETRTRPLPFEATAGWTATIEALAAEVLLSPPVRTADVGDVPTFDSGLAVLAALTRDPVAGERGVLRWLDDAERVATSGALFGGFGGLLAGVAVAQAHVPSLAALTNTLIGTVTELAHLQHPQQQPLTWQDYDLISGPSGSILALIAADASPEHVAPIAEYLALFTTEPDIGQLRIGTYQHDALRYWNYGRINTGLAHGVGGVALALSAVAGAYPTLRDRLIAPLQWLAAWMIAEAYEDGSGLRTWSPAAREGRSQPSGLSHREAWCYGTPGLAWVLYEVGCALDDAEVRDFAVDAMASYCRVFDERRFIDATPISDELAICHGVAGILAIADAFSRHAELAAAEALARTLEASLRTRVDDILLIATTNPTLLSGASGIIAVLLTRNGASRDWLRIVGLR